MTNGETATLGKVGGLMVIRHSWSNSQCSVVLVDCYDKEVIQIAGREYTDIPVEITWEGSGYSTQMKITSTYATTSAETVFYIAWQWLYD